MTRRKICSRFDPAAARSARDASSATVPSATLLPAVHDDHARADLLDQVQQVRREQNRRARRAPRATIVSRIRRMPIGSRPVSGSSNSSVGRVADEAARDDDLLPHAARQLARQRPLLAGQLELLEQRARRGGRSRSTRVEARRPAAGAPRRSGTRTGAARRA